MFDAIKTNGYCIVYIYIKYLGDNQMNQGLSGPRVNWTTYKG